ncbi:MAG: protein kinase, partial [Candidatus Riflebacteria bacterium]|nr:protein kinase [Candidatus Riflebacteria bacterium]
MLGVLGLALVRAALIGLAVFVGVFYLGSPDHLGMTGAYTRDILFNLAPTPPPVTSSPVLFVSVGQAEIAARPVSQAQFVDRRIYAPAVDLLSEMGARLIVLGPTISKADAEAGADAALEAAVLRSGRVLLGQSFEPYFGHHADELVVPLARLSAVAAGAGFVDMFLNIDGVVRAALPETTIRGRRVPHLALVAAARLDARRGATGGPGGADRPWTGPSAFDLAIPLDRYGLAIIDFPAVPRIPRIDLSELVSGRGDRATLRSVVSGRTVVIAETDPFRRQFYPYLVRYPAGQYAYGEGGWLLSVVVSAFLNRRFLDDPWPRLGRWPVVGLVLLAALLWRLKALAVTALALTVLVGSWLAAAGLRTAGFLLDAYAISQVVGILSLARLADLRLTRALQLLRLTRMLRTKTRIVARRAGLSDPTRPAEPDSLALDTSDLALLVELLPSRYSELSLLGAGGMGLVYRARDTRTGGWVALKLLRPTAHLGAKALQRFLGEMRLLERLDHPGLVRILDVHLEALAFFTMELVSGRSLDRRLAESGPLAPLGAVLIARELAEILAYVHARGVLHRDVKPSNVMILENGSVKLLDFGVARDQDATGLTLTGDVVGTLRYMAPEQLTAVGATAASDAYSVGVVVCELITGAVPDRDGV